MTTSEANARQQGCSQKTRNGSQFLATRVTAATSIQTPGNNLGTGLGAQCAHPAAAPTQASRAPHERACTSTGTSRGHAGTDHPHRHARRLGEQERHKKARAHPSAGLTLPTPPGLRSAATYDKADPHRVWPACRKQRLRHVDHADASFLSTTRPSSSKVPMASRRRISSGQCAMKSRASTV